jgi:hypothetical protein
MSVSVFPPFKVFTDIDGLPLDNGDIYIGVANLDPLTNPQVAYWDAALTQVATQPIKTRGGYPLNGSAIGNLYALNDYGILVANSAGGVVYVSTGTTDILPISQGGTGGATVATAATSLQGTGLDTNAVGFRTIPQNVQSTNYVTVAADSGKHLFTSTGSITFTIAANSSVAYPIGTAITFVNTNASTISIAINSDVMTLASTTTTGTRTLAQNGVATALKVGATSWLISGTGLT